MTALLLPPGTEIAVDVRGSTQWARAMFGSTRTDARLGLSRQRYRASGPLSPRPTRGDDFEGLRDRAAALSHSPTLPSLLTMTLGSSRTSRVTTTLGLACAPAQFPGGGPQRSDNGQLPLPVREPDASLSGFARGECVKDAALGTGQNEACGPPPPSFLPIARGRISRSTAGQFLRA